MNEQDDVLLRYLDGTLTDQEKESLLSQLATSPELKSKLEALERTHAFLVGSGALQNPSANFTQRVMMGINMPQAFSPRNGIYLLLGIMVASGLLISILSGNTFEPVTIGIESEFVRQVWMKAPSLSIPFDLGLVIKSIVFVNLGLALVMLDRTILKPLFRNRGSVNFF